MSDDTSWERPGGPLTPDERRVLDFLLAGEDPVLAPLRAQLAVAEAGSREGSDGGFYVPQGPRVRIGEVVRHPVEPR
jgi:hypothetical protein